MAESQSTLCYSLCSLHTRPDLLDSCAELLKSTWPTCNTGRLGQLETEKCTGLPCSLVLLEHRRENYTEDVIGHVRLVTVTRPESPKSAFVEAVCINRSKQGLGLGKELMILAEKYAADQLGCKHVFLICLENMRRFYERLSYEEYPVLTLETVGANMLVTFNRLSWYGNRPEIGWESAYDDGPIVSKDDMKRQIHGQLTMRKKLTAACLHSSQDDQTASLETWS